MGILADMKKNAIIFQKPSGTIAIRIDLNALQRKFYDALLCVARTVLKKNINEEYFMLSLADLKFLLKMEKDNKNNKYYIEKLKELKKKNAEYNILDKDSKWDIEGLVSLVSDLRIKREKKTDKVIITFELPSLIRKSLIDPKGLYANINLVIVAGLKSRYAIILYEMIEDYRKVEIPEMTIEKFRELFNIENKYPKMPNLRERVLDPAVNEINQSENINFLVSYDLKKSGKAYTHIKFHIKPKPAKLKLHQQAKVIEIGIKENKEIKELLDMIPSEYRRKEKVVSLILESVEVKGKEYTKAQIEYTVSKFNSGKVKDFVAYLKQAIEKDYASFEVVELDVGDNGLITVGDVIGYRVYVKHEGEDKYVEFAHVEMKKNESEDIIGYDKERIYLVRLDDVETHKVVTWMEIKEKSLLEYAAKNVKSRKE